MQIRRLTYLEEPLLELAVSSDGSLFACSNYAKLYVGAIDSDSVSLLGSDGAYLRPSCSPDGSRIVCMDGSEYHEGDNQSDLAIVDASTGSKERLTHWGDEIAPVFTADGTSVLYISRWGGACNIRAIRTGTRDITKFTHARSSGNSTLSTYADPVPSPDGQWVYCLSSVHSRRREGNPEVYRLSPNAEGQQRLTFTGGRAMRFLVSADGRQIAYSTWTEDRIPGRPMVDIWLMNADGTDQRLLEEGTSVSFIESFSPDGKWLAVSSSRARVSRERSGLAWGIYLINTQSGEAVAVTENAYNDRHPLFASGDRGIVFSSDRDGDGDLYLLTDFL